MTKLDATMLALGFALFGVGCDTSSLPSTAPTVPTQNVVTRIWGVISDMAFRPLAGVRVEIADGPQAGASVISGADGEFSFSNALVDAATTFRATMEGYVTATRTWDVRLMRGSGGMGIELESLAPPVKIEAGDYTLTLFADSACADLPDELHTRTYAATITPGPGLPANMQYNVTLNGPFLRPNPFSPRIGVAGNYLRFVFGEEATLSEHLPPFTYLDIAGDAATSVETSTISTISMPLHAGFQYCALKSEMGRFSNCFTAPPDQVIARSTCVSTNHRLILTRRDARP